MKPKLSPRQLEMLRTIRQTPRHSHSFLREEFSAAPTELMLTLTRELSDMENAALVELSGRWWYITEAGRNLLDATPALTPARDFGNASMREPLRLKPMASVRSGADNHLQYVSLKVS